MEFPSLTGIAELFAVRLFIAIVVMHAEVGVTPLLAAYVALPIVFVTRTTPGDTAGCFLLPREIRDSRTRMVIGEGNVDEMVCRVNRDLEKVSQAAVGASRVKAGG